MRDINFSGSLGEFKDSIGMNQPKRGRKADGMRKTAEALMEAKIGIREINAFEKELPPDSPLSPRIAKRREQYRAFVKKNDKTV
jgi:hypothetical protein